MKSITKKIGICVIAVLLTIGITAGLVLRDNVSTKAAGTDDNGETPITIDAKTPILDRIMENDGKLVILEIVPCEYGSVMNMLFGSEKVINRLESRKKELFNEYSWTKVVNGLTETVTVGVNGSSRAFGAHPFTITYNTLTKEYTVNYPNFFLEEFLNGYNNPQALSYFSKNTEIRTVVAGKLTEEDLKDVSLIYISGTVEDPQLVYFNEYIDGVIDETATNQGSVPETTGAYSKDGNGNFIEYKPGESGNIWYDCYVKDDEGNYISSDMKWDMVDKLVRYIYSGTIYTDKKPVPCIINYGNPKSKNCNVHKLSNILFKTTDEEGSKYTNAGGSVDTYYMNILNNIITYEGELGEGEETQTPSISLFVHDTNNWGAVTVEILNDKNELISTEEMTANAENPEWFELEVPYQDALKFSFGNKDAGVSTTAISDMAVGSYWLEFEEPAPGLWGIEKNSNTPEGWIEPEEVTSSDVVIYVKDTNNWGKIFINFINDTDEVTATEEMTANEENAGWYEYKIPYEEGMRFYFSNDELNVKTLAFSDASVGSFWLNFEAVTETGLFEIKPSTESPEGWEEKKEDTTPQITLFFHNAKNWDKINVNVLDESDNVVSTEEMTANAENPEWYELVIPYSDGIKISFTNGDSSAQSVVVSDFTDGKFWIECSEPAPELWSMNKSDSAPENWKEKQRKYYENDYGQVTGVYLSNGKEYLTWDDNSVPFFDMQCTLDNQYIFNYVYKTNNNGNNSIFSIGRGVPALDDNGTAEKRGIGDTASKKFTAADILKYLLGVQENNASMIRVLEIEPCYDFNYTYKASDSDNKKLQVVKNILALGKALKIKEYTACAEEVPAYESIEKKIEFTSMTVKQFNGMNENLMSTYDIIYIGDNSGMFNYTGKDNEPGKFYDSTGINLLSSFYKDSNIKFSKHIPIYNDKKLDGYVYTAFGDLIKGDTLYLGYLPSDYMEVTVKNYNYNSSNHDQTINNFETNWNDKTTWKFYSSLSTTGLTKGSAIAFSMDTSVPDNETLWTPLLWNALSKNDNKAHFYVVKDIRDNLLNNFPTNVAVDNFSNTLGNMRFMANDLSKIKRSEIEEFISYGNPVILADNVYNCTNENIYSKKGGVVYPTSQVYALVEKYNSSDSVIEEGRIYKNLISAFNENKLEITKCDVQYKTGASWTPVPELTYTSDLISESSFIVKPEKLRFTVDYKATPGRTYKVSLIFDKDTKGKYNDVATTDDKNEVMYSTKVIAKSVNEQITFDVAIPGGYNGFYSWRVLITALTNDEKTVDEDVYDGAVPIRGDKKEVRALQIVPNYSCNLVMNDKTNTFYSYMQAGGALINYDITVDVISADDFEKIYQSRPYHAGDYYEDNNFLAKGNGTYYGHYSMVIIGFADSFGFQDISDDNGALTNILEFEATGGSLLLSHDTIGFCNNVNYGVVSAGNNSSMSKIYKGCQMYNNIYGDKEAIDIVRKLRYIGGQDRYHVTAIPSLAAEYLEDANVPKDIDGNYITEIQGYTDYWLQFYSMSRNLKTYAEAHDGKIYYDNGGQGIKSVDGRVKSDVTLGTTKNALNYGLYSMWTITTTKADELNKGQITSYPYKTTDSKGQIEISPTHGQYNALDIEDEDVVVWYTLGNNNNSSSKYYADNPGDATNNYYIYSKGNITYSGAGHQTIEKTSELKLFVNTVIKAADAGNYVPEVEVLNGSRTTAEHEYIIYASSLDDKVKVEYVAKDNDLATRETVSTTYKTEEEILNHIGRFVKGAVYWLDENEQPHTLISYSNTGNLLLNGERYNFYICNPDQYPTENPGINADVMRQCYLQYVTKGTVKLKFEATDSKGASGYSIATVMNHDLFDLD